MQLPVNRNVEFNLRKKVYVEHKKTWAIFLKYSSLKKWAQLYIGDKPIRGKSSNLLKGFLTNALQDYNGE